LTIESSRLVTQ